MSMKLTALMLEHGPADPLAKLVAMCLTDRANDQNICWPSRDDLIARTGASYATISRKLRLLEVQGYIQRQRRFNNSTVFRINALRLHQAEAEAQRARALAVPKGFEPFEEEMAAAPVPQAIENKGSVHSDPPSVHSEPPLVHSEPLTSHKPINKPRAIRRRVFSLSSLTPFQRSRVLAGQSVVIDGVALRSGSAEIETLARALRAGHAEKEVA